MTRVLINDNYCKEIDEIGNYKYGYIWYEFKNLAMILIEKFNIQLAIYNIFPQINSFKYGHIW